MATSERGDSDDYEIIYRTVITLRNGKKLHASACGLKAFPIKIPKGKLRKNDSESKKKDDK